MAGSASIIISKKHQGPTDVSSISGAVLINDNVINIKRGQDNHDIPVTIAVPGAVLPNITHRHYLETARTSVAVLLTCSQRCGAEVPKLKLK